MCVGGTTIVPTELPDHCKFNTFLPPRSKKEGDKNTIGMQGVNKFSFGTNLPLVPEENLVPLDCLYYFKR